MLRAKDLRGHLVELVVVFVGVGLAFAVENLREDLNERRVGAQYLRGFQQDLAADAEMLQRQLEIRQGQLDHALTVLEFFEGRPIEPHAFFEAYYSALLAFSTTPNRNTIDEVLNSGSLRLIRDAEIRTGLLSLYAKYDEIAGHEEHIARDFDAYLYDPTFTSIPVQLEGPWEDSPRNRRAVETLLNDVTVENGIRLIVGNLQFDGAGLLDQLRSAQAQVDRLVRMMPPD